MRSRSLYALTLSLLFVLAACNSKPADTAATSTAQSPNSSNAVPAGGQQAAASAPAPAVAPAPAPPPPVVVPQGTTLTVRLAQSLGSKINSAGDTFKATLAEPVEVDGNAVIPAGASVQGKVVQAQPLGKIKGAALLEVRLTSVSIGGTEHAIDTTAVERTEKGKGKRTAEIAGGGAALGGIIGGIAGGGKGAAIGLLAGGGAGGAGAAYTGNKDIVLPAEAALSFKLKAPLEIKP